MNTSQIAAKKSADSTALTAASHIDPLRTGRISALEHRLPPPFVAVAVGLGMWSASFLQPPLPLDPLVHYSAAGLVGLFALLVGGAGIREFRRARTTINPVRIDAASRMVTGGIFRLTRNPMYVGLTALLLGWAFVLAVPAALLGPVLFALFTHRFQILPEERVMSAKFGAEYQSYCQRVRRWL